MERDRISALTDCIFIVGRRNGIQLANLVYSLPAFASDAIQLTSEISSGAI